MGKQLVWCLMFSMRPGKHWHPQQKRATECLGGQADKSSNRFKPSQVIHHQEAFPFLRNKKIPIKEESFSCLVYKLLRCIPEYIRQVCNRALKRVWRDRYSCFVTQTWLLETWHRKCGKIPGSLQSMATFLNVSLYACFHKLKKNTFLSCVQSLNPTCFWERVLP